MDDRVALRVREIVQDVRPELDVSRLGESVNFDDAGFDSLDHASILFNVQEAFGLVIPDDVVDTLKSITAIAAFVEERRATRGGNG